MNEQTKHILTSGWKHLVSRFEEIKARAKAGPAEKAEDSDGEHVRLNA